MVLAVTRLLLAFQTRDGVAYTLTFYVIMLTLSRCIALNAASLACGFAGNIFLLFNFTRRIRYIVALPMTIILWYFATGIVRGPILHLHGRRVYDEPDESVTD